MPKTVFCVDDDMDDRELICEAIHKIDPSIRLLHAENGLSGMNMLQDLKKKNDLPDMVILDINMPVFGGMEMLEEMMSDKQFSAIPTFVFSTSPYPPDRNFFQRYGIVLYKKPDNFRAIQDTVQQMLETLR